MNDGHMSRLTPVAQSVRTDDHRGDRIRSEMMAAPRPEAADEVNLFQLLALFWQGKWVLAGCAALFLLVGGYYAYELADTKYSSTVQLAMQVRDQSVVDLDSVISGVSSDSSSINTELEVIKSRALIERLVDQMNLVEDAEFNPFLQERPKYTPQAVFQRVNALIFGAEPKATPSEERVKLATTRNVTRAVTVTATRGTYLLNISFVSTDRRKSAKLANRLADIYLDDQIRIKFSATEFAIDWLADRVAELEFELKQKEDKVKELRGQTNLISLEALEALNVRAKSMRDRTVEAEMVRKAAENRVTQYATAIQNGDLVEMAMVFRDGTLDSLLRAAQDGQGNAEAEFRNRVAELMAQAEADAERAALQHNTLMASLAQLQEQITLQNEDVARLNQLVRDAEGTRVLYETFLSRLKETSVQVGLHRPDSRILSEAIPGQQIQPKRRLILILSVFLGLLCGAAIVLARQFLHEVFRTGEELESATGLLVLGQIPRLPIRKRGGLVGYLSTKTTSAAAEAVRNLRTSVLLSNVDHPPKVIMLTSSVPGEGKTTVSIALAQNLGSLGKRVLLVEGDIRRRTFAQYFTQESPYGLVSVVLGDVSIDQATFHDPDVGADILMGEKSSTNAADLYTSEKFHNFIETARAEYDFIIIDTPPVMVVPDARVIGAAVDAILYVVNWDRTRRNQVADGLRQFSSVGVPVSGLVLSKIDAKQMKRYGYGGRYGAYASYGSGYYDKA
jgi:capsular exopolysaccharide synthesis family protein